MKDSKSDLLLHPIRLRIIQSFLGSRELTVQQVAKYLPDIPQATLYRHFNLLIQGKLLIVKQQNQIRGTVEKVYALAQGGESVTQSNGDFDRESMMRQFMLFITMLLDDFEAYLKRPSDIDPLRDGIGFRQASFYLSDEELRQLYSKIGAAFQEVAQNEPSPERMRRTISTIIMPGRETNDNAIHNEKSGGGE